MMGRFIQVAIFSAILVFGAGLANAHHVKCSRDIDNDGKANRADTQIIEKAMGSKLGAPPYDERADINQDEVVNQDDRDDYLHCLPPALDRSRRSSH